MKKFDIELFLQEHNIDYRLAGNNVAKGNLNIDCPWCKDSKGKFHMGINIDKLVYGCWKDTQHRGNKLAYLISCLIHCSYKRAKQIIGESKIKIDGEISLNATLNRLLYKNSNNTTCESNDREGYDLSEFDTFKTISYDSNHYNYLTTRGFDDIMLLIDKYDLRYSTLKSWKDRVIFPIHINDQLVTWQGRDVTGKAYLRYKDLSKDKSKTFLKSCIYNYDNLVNGGDILYVCEGIFDAIKIDFYTHSNVSATCVFTKTVSKEQYRLLFKIVNKFKQVRILFDQNTVKQANRVKGELSVFNKNIKVVYLDSSIKDAGDMSKEQIKEMIS